MLIFVLVLLIVQQVPWISCKCTFENFNFDYPPVFTQVIGENEIVLKPLSLQLHISEGASLIAYCDSNFSTPIFGSRSEAEGVSSVKVACSKGVLYYEDIFDEEKRQEAREQLACFGSQPDFYANYAESNCGNVRGKSLTYGFTVNRHQIILSTLCFNFETMDVVYIHYKSSDQSYKLKDVRNDYGYIRPENKVAMNFIGSNDNRTYELNSYLRRNTALSENIGLFKFDYLVPLKRLVKSYPYQVDILEGPNSIPWWINLREGNWKLFEQLLEKEMVLNDYDVYTGVSHSYEVEDMKFEIEEKQRERAREFQQQRAKEEEAKKEKERLEKLEREKERLSLRPTVLSTPQLTIHPSYYGRNRSYTSYSGSPPSRSYRPTRSALFDNFYDDDIRYMSGSNIKAVPLYVWTYLKSPTGDGNSTVVFAVNSPFIEVNKFYHIDFCRDNCPPWLSELSTSAKIPALGYMFCCRPEVARDYIRSLP